MDAAQTDNGARLVVKLQGGIGNQLFQLGLGDYLAQSSGHPVAYLIDAFAEDPYRRKNIVPRLFPEAPLVQLSDIAGPDCRILQESTLNGHLSAANLQHTLRTQCVLHCILDGYWQDRSYINDTFVNQIRSRLYTHTRKTASEATLSLIARIQCAKNPVAVHVRRHDYKHHGICQENYYIDTLRWTMEQVAHSEVIVFSDEPNYTGHFLRQAGIAHQMVATGDDLLDLYLMSHCKMHVIANSTYSWWGAQLAGNRLVFYPLPWSAVHKPVANFFPSHWIAIDGAVSSAIETLSYKAALNRLSSET